MSRAHSSCVRPTPPDFVTLAEDVTFSLRGGLAAARSLALWRTHWAFDDADATSEFERQPDIAVAADGTFALRVEVDSLYTVTTLLAAGAKGAPSAPPPPASQASQFPAWLADDFDACAPPAEADLFCDQSGAFECVESGDPRRGVVMRQMTPVKPIGWGGDVRPHSLVGHRDTVNASLAVSVMLPDANASAVLGLRMRALIDSQGVVFGVNATSAAWSVWSSVGNVGRPQAFASGALAAPLGVGEWHALRLDANGSLLRAWVDGAEVTPAGGLEVGALGASGHAMIGAGDFGQFPLYDAFSLASSATMCDQAAAPAAGLPLATVQCSSEVGVAPLSTFACECQGRRGGAPSPPVRRGAAQWRANARPLTRARARARARSFPPSRARNAHTHSATPNHNCGALQQSCPQTSALTSGRAASRCARRSAARRRCASRRSTRPAARRPRAGRSCSPPAPRGTTRCRRGRGTSTPFVLRTSAIRTSLTRRRGAASTWAPARSCPTPGGSSASQTRA